MANILVPIVGNDAHYTLELFLALIRHRIANRESITNEDSDPVGGLNGLSISS